MRHRANLLAMVLTISAAACAAIALSGPLAAGRAPDVPGGWEIVPRQQDFGEVPAGSEVRLQFRVINHADTPLSILGSNDRCDVEGCLRSVGLPLTVPPRDSVRLEVKTFFGPRITSPDGRMPYARTLIVYSSRKGRRQIEIEVSGHVVDAATVHDPDRPDGPGSRSEVTGAPSAARASRPLIR